MPPRLLDLPPELIQHILALLQPSSLVKVAPTCRRLYEISYDDRIWQPLVNDNLADGLTDPSPAKSFRELYIAHHPHWFLTKRRIWFADSAPTGNLVLARYDPSRGCITAHSIVAPICRRNISIWEKNRKVTIHDVEPRIMLSLCRPVVRLDLENAQAEPTPNHTPSDRNHAPASLYSKETLMRAFSESGLYSSFMLCRALPEPAITEQTAVWPPLRFAASHRARNDSQDRYSSAGHRPSRLAEVSHNNFRVRSWVEYTGRRTVPSWIDFSSGRSLAAALDAGMPYSANGLGPSAGGVNIRMPGLIVTYASLAESSYTPTPQKPWQGIFCGDLGLDEFLVITQPDQSPHDNAPRDAPCHPHAPPLPRPGPGPSSVPTPGEEDVSDAPSGCIVAIKLTGHPAVPCGEYSFIAPDIGDAGLIRIADEEIFRGARIVRSEGHIAGRDFTEGDYSPSQLILISHDRLAQWWEELDAIVCYRRVDLDALMKSPFEEE